MKRVYLLVLGLVLSSIFMLAQNRYQLSSHILDITKGKPATGVLIKLYKQDNSGKWIYLDERETDINGRVKDFLKEEGGNNNNGIYKLIFYTEPYFKALGEQSFYPFIEVVFKIADGNHYHVPITLSPFGYSTYRGN